MKRLLIFRHAKAGPHDEAHDSERALIERGRNDAALMGSAMRDRGYVPELVLSSSAKRTRETWEHAAPAFGAKPEARFLAELYDAPEKSILKTIRGVKDRASVVMYIGHNPGLENLARKLVRGPEDPAEKRRIAAMEKKFPTSAVAVIDFDAGTWEDVDSGKGILTDFFTPADFKNA
jgi:phosphohistidine phosphatase